MLKSMTPTYRLDSRRLAVVEVTMTVLDVHYKSERVYQNQFRFSLTINAMKMTILLSWLITILVPIALIGLGLRVLLTPFFLKIEYNMPYFPADEYGFTKADRLKWAPYALNYLVNSADIS